MFWKSLDFLSKKKKHSPTALSQEDVIEIAFYIYIPVGARMENQNTRSSTWLTPIIEGEEGLKLIGKMNILLNLILISFWILRVM